ncbi:peptidase [Listeria monocytogenes]|nr:peptidase [Listeria monocytogenes]ALQ20726.1 peptidase [Listeria monocytogenes]ODG04253.1 peptidase [Listeria monocytogenes]OEO48135.1 peptidase [Listeria monocytogenes]OEP19762.1 peptidase [Listeria monocytogenes]
MRNRKPKRKIGKWIAIILGIIIVFVVAAFLYIRYAEKPVTNAETEALDRISGQVDLKTTDQFYLYNGPKEVYYVLTGKNSKNQNIIVWVPKKKSDKVYVKFASDGITKQQARDKVTKEKNPKKILHVNLGMEKETPIWEVAYLDKNDKLNYFDINFETGEWYREIENL